MDGLEMQLFGYRPCANEESYLRRSVHGSISNRAMVSNSNLSLICVDSCHSWPILLTMSCICVNLCHLWLITLYSFISTNPSNLRQQISGKLKNYLHKIGDCFESSSFPKSVHSCLLFFSFESIRAIRGLFFLLCLYLCKSAPSVATSLLWHEN
jgi:hypothetical protein